MRSTSGCSTPRPTASRPDTLFLNVHSIKSVPDIVGPLRKMGLPPAAVVDLDVVTDDQKGTFNKLLKAAAVPGPVQESLANLRSKIAQAYARQGAKPKDVGLAGLAYKSDRESL